MADITHGTWIKDGKPVDKVYSNGKIVYGRNLLVGIDKNIKQASGWFQWVTNVPTKYMKTGYYICASLFINNSPYSQILGKGNAYLQAQIKDISSNTLISKNGNTIDFTSDGISQVSLLIPDKAYSMQIFVVTNNMNANTYYGYSKAEFGNTVTPWSQAPEDILN